MEKTVRFYRSLTIERGDDEHPVRTGFWAATHARIAKIAAKDRRFLVQGSLWYGDAGTGVQRTYPYIRCGRVRLRGDWPPVVHDSGMVEPLTLEQGNLFEAAYVVPFGNNELVALVGPLRGVVGKSSIETWIGALLGFPADGRSLRLEPVIDQSVARKLAESVGVSKLTVKVPARAPFTAVNGSVSEVERAFQSTNDLGHDLDRTMSFSHGHRRKDRAQDLLTAAKRLVGADGPTQIEATLMLPGKDGIRTETHSLIEERFAVSVPFNVDDDAQPDVETMLDGIHVAIQSFNQQR